MDLMTLGLRLMGYGLLGVFAVLVSFIVAIKVLTKVFPVKREEE